MDVETAELESMRRFMAAIELGDPEWVFDVDTDGMDMGRQPHLRIRWRGYFASVPVISWALVQPTIRELALRKMMGDCFTRWLRDTLRMPTD